MAIKENKALYPDPQQAPPDAKPIDSKRPPPIVPDAPTIDELEFTVEGTKVKPFATFAHGNPKLKSRDWSGRRR
jgi:hypothetical protein